MIQNIDQDQKNLNKNEYELDTARFTPAKLNDYYSNNMGIHNSDIVNMNNLIQGENYDSDDSGDSDGGRGTKSKRRFHVPKVFRDIEQDLRNKIKKMEAKNMDMTVVMIEKVIKEEIQIKKR